MIVKKTNSALLLIDSAINLLLGVLLILVPRPTISFFGLPETDTLFYVSILGAVLLGIGIALYLSTVDKFRSKGLGLAGAIVINILGAGAVAVWLIIDPFDLPPRGYVVLWAVVIIVAGVALLELVNEFSKPDRVHE